MRAARKTKLAIAASAISDIDKKRSRGSFYTPEPLAEWCAHLLKKGSNTEKFIDFGCGDGALLKAVCGETNYAECIGVELDAVEASRAQIIVGKNARVITCDVLSPPDIGTKTLPDYWRERVGFEPASIIMNPPWGATHCLDSEIAVKRGFTLASGQYDTYDLFCELAIRLLQPDEQFVFILPDSILLPEHRALRRLLLEQAEIGLIARLGEGIFPNVYRGCIVISGVRRTPRVDHRVECLRISKTERADLHSSKDFEKYRKRLSHRVLQQRFAQDPLHQFDIDVRDEDEVIAKMLSRGGGWTEPLWSSRGVEISKQGKVLVCHACGTARPLPKTKRPHCLSCGHALQANSLTCIIAGSPAEQNSDWVPFVAGEDVKRYAAVPSRWIRRKVKGINYKNSSPTSEPRLIIRKTGIGLNAGYLFDTAYTNQVIFEYGMDDVDEFDFNYLYYILGVINSRLIFAYHLKRTGELEWRSHPYVTQTTLARLPIPKPTENSQEWRQAAAIAEAVSRRIQSGEGEIEIEALVAGLYGLSTADIRWALDVIDSAADLEPMRNLRLPSSLEIFPVMAA